MPKPLIGLTPTPELTKQEHGSFRLHTLNAHYSQAIIDAGAIPVMLPSNNVDVPELLSHLDGLLITGGGDVDPALYGQEPHPKTDEIDAERDQFEQQVIAQAIRMDLPLLGICRGCQILNVYLGGSLTQDIADLHDNPLLHRQQDESLSHEEMTQIAKMEPGDNPLREILGSDQIGINTFHHQSIDRVADSLRVLARSDDGIVEAVQNPEMTFGFAVQWHPELLQHLHSEHSLIFKALVEAAIAYQQKRENREVPEPV